MSTVAEREAAILEASAQGRSDMNRFDGQTLDQLTELYRQASTDLQDQVDQYAGGDTLKLAQLQSMLAAANSRLAQLQQARDTLLQSSLKDSAALGTEPFAGDVATLGKSLGAIADEAVQFVNQFMAADGLQLSDRLWRLDNGAKQALEAAIQRAVILGASASEAAAGLLGRGEAIPPELAAKIAEASADKIGKAIDDALMTGSESAYAQALRVFRTELNRAYGEAYQAAAFEHPDVVGTRFLLSPNHPRRDICDMHARANLFGLGPGVYPKGQSPWPAHPNTLSYVEAVFADEVSAADRAGRMDRLTWLKGEPPAVQDDVLGKNKGKALRAGDLTEDQIDRPWREMRK
jgi:hypothetical protein